MKKWAKNHLNWAFILGMTAPYCLSSVIVFGAIVITGAISDIPIKTLQDIWSATMGLLGIVNWVGAFLLGSWILKEKGRDTRYVIWLVFAIVGVVVILALKNEPKVIKDAWATSAPINHET